MLGKVACTAVLAFSLLTTSVSATPHYHRTAEFGDIDRVHTKPHGGIDIGMPSGTTIRALMEGNVRVTDTGNKAYGKAVRITHGNKVLILGHLSSFTVHNGQHVKVGDVVGKSGNTGHSTGPHLHIQVNIRGKAVDPRPTVGVQLLIALIKGD